MTHTPIRTVVIGCGGIGVPLADGLSRALEFQAPRSGLILVDGDSYEPKNAERQSFDVLGNKALALRDKIRRHAPRTFVIGRAAWVVSQEAAERYNSVTNDEEEQAVGRITPEELMQEGDYVFCVVDNFAARKLIFDAAEKYDNIDVFTGGNDDRLYGTVIHYRRRNGKDVTLPPRVMHPEFRNPEDRNPGELSCQERAELEGGTQLMAVNMAVAAMLLAKVAHVIFGTDEEKEAAIEKAEIAFDLELAGMLAHDRRPVPDESTQLVSSSVSRVS